MESSANFYGIEFRYTIHKQFIIFVTYFLFDYLVLANITSGMFKDTRRL